MTECGWSGLLAQLVTRLPRGIPQPMVDGDGKQETALLPPGAVWAGWWPAKFTSMVYARDQQITNW